MCVDVLNVFGCTYILYYVYIYICLCRGLSRGFLMVFVETNAGFPLQVRHASCGEPHRREELERTWLAAMAVLGVLGSWWELGICGSKPAVFYLFIYFL